MESNNFILLMGKSGSGKSTIAKALYQKFGLAAIDSYTTRPPRCKNETGHIFVDDEEFDKLTNLVGFTEFNGYRYCATAEQVEENEIYIIDPEGVNYFTECYNGNKNPIVIYLDVPNNVCFERLFKRDGLKKALERYQNDKEAFKDAAAMADEVISTTDFCECVNQIYELWKF